VRARAPARPPRALWGRGVSGGAYVAREAEATATSVAAAAATTKTVALVRLLAWRHGGCRGPISIGSGSARGGGGEDDNDSLLLALAALAFGASIMN
jgi:hypothetical protein